MTPVALKKRLLEPSLVAIMAMRREKDFASST